MFRHRGPDPQASQQSKEPVHWGARRVRRLLREVSKPCGSVATRPKAKQLATTHAGRLGSHTWSRSSATSLTANILPTCGENSHARL
eukprot:9011929-Pyramimonas_sp.AAC.1